MKYIYAILLTLFLSFSIFLTDTHAATRVKGYTKKNGSYVQPYYRSNTNYRKSDNWSTKGNVNPYTGKRGSKNIWK